MNEIELEKGNKFINKHNNTKCYNGFLYKLTPTGIGMNIQILCRNCGEIEDITDYDCW